jgi:hypothetical protein
MKAHILSKDIFPIVKETLLNGKTITLTVSGTSMRPFLKDKISKVTLKAFETYKKCDIILYENELGHMVLHRITKKGVPFIVYGDALTKKELVPKDKIYGKVIELYEKDKIIKIENPFYKMKVIMWLTLKPFRRLLLRLVRK